MVPKRVVVVPGCQWWLVVCRGGPQRSFLFFVSFSSYRSFGGSWMPTMATCCAVLTAVPGYQRWLVVCGCVVVGESNSLVCSSIYFTDTYRRFCLPLFPIIFQLDGGSWMPMMASALRMGGCGWVKQWVRSTISLAVTNRNFLFRFFFEGYVFPSFIINHSFLINIKLRPTLPPSPTTLCGNNITIMWQTKSNATIVLHR